MKKIYMLFISLLLSMTLAVTVSAGTLGGFNSNKQTQQEETVEEPESGPGESEGAPGESEGAPADSAGEAASSAQLSVASGIQSFDGEEIHATDGTAVQVSGSAEAIFRNSYIEGDTTQETLPLEGNPGNLLVAGNIRTTLGIGNSQSYYINSKIISQNWAALSTDAAQPAGDDGKELSLYAYGTEAVVTEGGYGAYSDLFCNLYLYGSAIHAAEIGIISGTYGKVTLGTIEDGENDFAMSQVLTEEDKEYLLKEQESLVMGGRNALMIHSVNLPPYWEYEGYSQEELPLRYTEIEASKSTFATDLSLDQNIEYEPQKQAYIDHTKGSVILVKSTNASILLDRCELIADPEGTGYLIQSVYNNDTMFMNAVPDGEDYPGISVMMDGMDLQGDISHEDYQRDMYLALVHTSLKGAMLEGSCEDWIQAAQEEGFTDYSLDDHYDTHHGIYLSIESGSVWTVTKDSKLTGLYLEGNAKIEGEVYVEGILTNPEPEVVYKGNILVTPIQETETEPETTQKAVEVETTTAAPQHVHNFVSAGGYPPDCYVNGLKVYRCSCGEEKTEVLYSTGHNYVLIYEEAPLCEDYSVKTYQCSICGTKDDTLVDPVGHDYVYVWTQPALCETSGADFYECSRCFATISLNWENYPALGHDYSGLTYLDANHHEYFCRNCGETYFIETHSFQWTAFEYEHGYYCYICDSIFSTSPHTYTYTPIDSLQHRYDCTECTRFGYENHTGTDPCICGYSGPVG